MSSNIIYLIQSNVGKVQACLYRQGYKLRNYSYLSEPKSLCSYANKTTHLLKGKIIFYCIICTTFLSACYDNSEDMDIYSAAIEYYYPNNQNAYFLCNPKFVKKIGVAKLDNYSYENIKSKIEELDRATYDDFIVNIKHENLTINPKIENNTSAIRLLSKKEFKRFYQERNSISKRWEDITRKHPEMLGIIEFSNLGFNKEKKQALLYLGINSSEYVGSGRMLLMRKKAGRWKVAHSFEMWTI